MPFDSDVCSGFFLYLTAACAFKAAFVELEEIERAMDRLPGVERGCCVYDADRQKIRGFSTGRAEKKDVHAGLRKRLPAYMIPGELNRLDRLPVSRNGKLDRRELAKTGGGTL